jgi:hypothetical protein
MDDDWKVYMERLVHRLLLKRDIGEFKDPVDWEGTDYLTVVKRPMDINTVRSRLVDDMYNSREECIQDIRLIWDNAKLYNDPNSKLYALACQMDESFEVMLKNAVTSEGNKPVTTTAMQTFITNCHRIRREELREVLLKLESICPECIEKSSEDNKLNLEVDLISPDAFRQVNNMIKSYLSYLDKGLSDSGVKRMPEKTSSVSHSSSSSSSKKRRR